MPFYEFFHGETGEGLGASHQTGWTALVALMLQYGGNASFAGMEAVAPADPEQKKDLRPAQSELMVSPRRRKRSAAPTAEVAI